MKEDRKKRIDEFVVKAEQAVPKQWAKAKKNNLKYTKWEDWNVQLNVHFD